MRDHKRCSALTEMLHRLAHLQLRLGVERGRCFIQQYDRRIPDKRASDSDTLALAARKLQSVFAHGCVVAARERHDEIMRVGGLGGGDDLVFACSGFAEFDVFANRATEQEHILPDIGDVLAQRLTRTQSHILVVDENLAALCVIETQDQIEYRRFSAAGWTDQGGELARLRDKRHSTQYRFVTAVCEVNIIKR